MTSDQEYISRSALAEKLSLPLKDLTQIMINAGWILQAGKNWELTAKGEFEGGQYRQSDKYGQYIIWPVSIIDHPVIRDRNEALVTVSVLAKHFALPGRLLNRVFFELGWIESFARGWQVSSLGEGYGGVQCHDEESGVPYVMWPRGVQNDGALVNVLSQLADPQSLITLDGHQVSNSHECLVANWLYLLGLNYAYQRQLILPNSGMLSPNFYLPACKLCIDACSDSLSPAQLSKQLQQQQQYRDYGLHYLEINENDFSALDHILSKELLHLGVSVY